ncbi:MAG: hypothetical protein ACRD27_08950 [Terracidiphilus sp.]
MKSSRTITLFSEQTDASSGTSSLLASVLAHGAVIGMISFGVMYQPEFVHPIVAQHYAIRHLDLQTPKEQMRQAAGSAVKYPGPARMARAHAPGGKPVNRPPALREMARAAPGPQTLIQPDLPTQLALKRVVPAPTVVIWTPVKVVVKTIVAPLPAPPTSADATPSLAPPNEEVNLAEVELASSDLPAQNLQLFAGTTSPVVVSRPGKVQMAPVTTTQTAAQPTPATVVSLSDLAMPNGIATLPAVNETDAKALPGPMTPGQTKDLGAAGRGNVASKAGGIGSGQDAGAQTSKQDAAGAAGKQNGAQAGAAQGAANGTGASNQPTADRITLPVDGEFSSVIVGDALEDEFPEAANAWGGRIAYTVYLHVGLSKSWILQYSLPAAAAAAAAGEVARLEAPWPYNIVRPNLAPGSIDADALLVHGFVNQSGRFESLAIDFPPDFTQSQFVLNSLKQWQFRPATENGQTAKVEVLLIIPAELDSGMMKQPRLTAGALLKSLGMVVPSPRTAGSR